MRRILIAALGAALALATLPDEAAAQPRSRGVGPTDRPPQAVPGVPPRPQAAPRSGTITATTPNASGNLGGPSTGGGGGGP